MIYQDSAQDAVGFGQDVLQRFFYVLLGVGECDDADGGGLPDIVEIEFGDGDIEFAAEAVFEAAEDLALVLEGASVGDVEFESEEAYGHSKKYNAQRYKVQVQQRASRS